MAILVNSTPKKKKNISFLLAELLRLLARLG
jgi:hypothetical protein